MHTQTEVVVPETFEGWAMLHAYYRVDWPSWKRLSAAEKTAHILELEQFFARTQKDPSQGSSAYFAVLGHKADILFLHFKRSFEELTLLDLEFKHTGIYHFLTPTTSYVSVVELGMYEYTMKLERQLSSEGLTVASESWQARWREEMAKQRERVMSRLYTPIPEDTFLCFYPMNKRRGEHVNWYHAPMEARAKMMLDHGMIGRKYGGQVTQIISGSIGYDAWEWGVDLFSNDPLVFKKLVYEMRFDEASALYGEFGDFILSMRIPTRRLEDFFKGQRFIS